LSSRKHVGRDTDFGQRRYGVLDDAGHVFLTDLQRFLLTSDSANIMLANQQANIYNTDAR